MIVDPGRILKYFFSGKIVWDVPVNARNIFLSFDDGPIPEVTLPLLDILDKYQVKATFFCVGDNVFHHWPVYKEIQDRGHKTGNHTFHHLNGWNTNNKKYFDDIQRCSELVHSCLFRPPYGKMTPLQIRALANKFTIIYWSVLSYDFDPARSADQCLQICLNRLKEGRIFVFHDSLKAGNKMLTVVPRFIENALAAGYHFSTIPDQL